MGQASCTNALLGLLLLCESANHYLVTCPARGRHVTCLPQQQGRTAECASWRVPQQGPSMHTSRASSCEPPSKDLVEALLVLAQGERVLPCTWRGSRAPHFTVNPGKTNTRRAFSYEPPSEDLVEALLVLARYVSVLERPGDRDAPVAPAQAGNAAWLPLSPVQPAGPPQVACNDAASLLLCMDPCAWFYTCPTGPHRRTACTHDAVCPTAGLFQGTTCAAVQAARGRWPPRLGAAAAPPAQVCGSEVVAPACMSQPPLVAPGCPYLYSICLCSSPGRR